MNKKIIFNFEFESIGTHWHIEFFCDVSKIESIKENILNLVKDFESRFSRFILDSEISVLKNKIGKFNVSAEFIEIINLYFDFYEISEKKFTPLIGKNLEELGYDHNYSFISQKKISKIPDLYQTIKVLDKNKIEIKKNISFDFGGLGKGFLINKIKNYFDSINLEHYLIDGGGDIYFFSLIETSIKIGLENPNNNKEILDYIDLESGFGICCSSNNKRKWSNHSHIPDFRSNIIANWIITKNIIVCDALSTILSLIEINEPIKSKYHFFQIYLDSNNSMKRELYINT